MLAGPRRAIADRLALCRAFHTVGVELAERGDDSYGNIGELRLDAFRTYLSIDWAAAVIAEHESRERADLDHSRDVGGSGEGVEQGEVAAS